MTTAWGRCSVLRTRPNPAYPLPLESIAEAMRSNSFSPPVLSAPMQKTDCYFSLPRKNRDVSLPGRWTGGTCAGPGGPHGDAVPGIRRRRNGDS